MRLATVAVGLTLATTSAFAQSSNQPMTGGPSTEDFVKAVATSDMFEIAVSKLAQTNGTAEEKSFSEQMIRDHTQTTSE